MPSKHTTLGSVSRTTGNWALWEMLVISREVEAEGLEIQGYYCLYNKVRVMLVYMKPCLETESKQTEN